MKWVLLVLALLALPVLAQDTSRQADLERDLAAFERLRLGREAQLGELNSALANTSAELQAQVAERDRLGREIGALQQERERLQGQIGDLNLELAATQARILELDAQLERLKVRVQGLLASLYRQRGGARVAGILSEVGSLHELQVKNHYLSLLSLQDVSLITQLDSTLNELAAEQARYRARLDDLTQAEAALSGNQAALDAERRSLSGVIAQLEESREGQLANQRTLLEEQRSFEARVAQLNRDLEAELARLERLERERREREAAAAAAQARSQQRQPSPGPAPTPAPAPPRLQDLPPLTSGYSYPVAEPRLLRRYGESGVSGVWLQTRQPGSAVRSVQPGLVVEVGPLTANQGYIVVLRHAQGLVTAYVNLQPSPPVAVGQQVAQEQLIGYLGGGSLIPPDVLEFHAAWTEGGRLAWTDPAELLGF